MALSSFIQKLGFGSGKPYQTGLALGGGGARGFAHLGVIQRLKEKGIQPQIIAGTSAGALAGAFIAAGHEPRKVLDILKKQDVLSYSKIRWPRYGLFNLDGLRKVLKKEIQQTRIEELETPLIITVTDLNEGKAVYLDKGDLVNAVLASTSIPFVFALVELNGVKCADGGIMDNLPVKPLMDKCKKVIAVSISPIEETSDLDNLFKISSRAFQLAVNAHTENLRKHCSRFIEPEGIREYDLFNVKQADALFQLGYDSV